MVRRLRIVLEWSLFALLVALLTLWAQTFFQLFLMELRHNKVAIDTRCVAGQVFLDAKLLTNTKSYYVDRISWRTGSAADTQGFRRQRQGKSYSYQDNGREKEVWLTFGFWIPALIAVILALLVKPPPRFRISMREWFLRTTLAICIVGGLAALFRFGA